jgi:hypothetical protein
MLFSNARLALMLAKALFFDIGRRADEKLGKIWLASSMRKSPLKNQGVLPIPPGQQVPNFILLVQIIKQVKN